MKMGKIINEIKDLLDGDDLEQYDMVINVGKKADNVSIKEDGNILYVEGWVGNHQPPGAMA